MQKPLSNSERDFNYYEKPQKLTPLFLFPAHCPQQQLVQISRVDFKGPPIFAVGFFSLEVKRLQRLFGIILHSNLSDEGT